jgi:hypothetical protein
MHRFASSDLNVDLIAAFLEAGIESGDVTDATHFFAFEIEESDPRWSAVMAAGRKYRAIHSVLTSFSKSELLKSDYVMLGNPVWYNGYPEPSDDFGFAEITYDFSEYCRECGVGYRQKAPFRLKKVPTWGRRSTFQLNWIMEEYFVPDTLWRSIFEPFGIGCRSIVHSRTGAILDNVVQLDISTIVDADLADPRLSHIDIRTCPVCRRPRCEGWMDRGYSPRPAKTNAAMIKSTQYYGTGGQAGRLVFVSHESYTKIADFRGVSFKACLPAFPDLPDLRLKGPR